MDLYIGTMSGIQESGVVQKYSFDRGTLRLLMEFATGVDEAAQRAHPAIISALTLRVRKLHEDKLEAARANVVAVEALHVQSWMNT